jgi:hypothetical protein
MYSKAVRDCPAGVPCLLLKAQLDRAWLGSFYVITDVIDKESYSNAPCIRPGAAVEDCGWQENNTITRRVIPQAEQVTSPHPTSGAPSS